MFLFTINVKYSTCFEVGFKTKVKKTKEEEKEGK